MPKQVTQINMESLSCADMGAWMRNKWILSNRYQKVSSTFLLANGGGGKSTRIISFFSVSFVLPISQTIHLKDQL
jgi:hypothetical protein